MIAIQLQQDGKFYLLPEYPEEPGNQRDVTAEYAEVMVEYEQAIERSKSNAILVKNQEDALMYLIPVVLRAEHSPQPDTVYFLEGYEAEILECHPLVEYFQHTGDPTSLWGQTGFGSRMNRHEKLALIHPHSKMKTH